MLSRFIAAPRSVTCMHSTAANRGLGNLIHGDYEGLHVRVLAKRQALRLRACKTCSAACPSFRQESCTAAPMASTMAAYFLFYKLAALDFTLWEPNRLIPLCPGAADVLDQSLDGGPAIPGTDDCYGAMHM